MEGTAQRVQSYSSTVRNHTKQMPYTVLSQSVKHVRRDHARHGAVLRNEGVVGDGI